jgi:ubiquinone/menaquinone biosynthesis C-methylase UbiE
MTLLRLLKVWRLLLTNVGFGMRAGRQADQLFRYYTLKTLADIGFFDYLKEPRTYGQVLAEFEFADNAYTRELLKILATDKHNVIIEENDRYRRNPSQALPHLDATISRTDKRIHNFVLLAEGTARTVIPRLRNESVALSDTFEQEGRQFLTKFDKVLGNHIYSAMREAAFTYLKGEERDWLRGKTLLDVGCGSGRETAEIWLKLGGNIHITAIDAIPGMLELAERDFAIILKEINPAHPPLVDSNRPTFKLANATQLPFDDNSFDSLFWLFVLHWTSDPRKAISEAVRVVKPGGLIFGAQAFKPEANPYFDLIIRTNENCHGFFWREEYRHWFGEHGLEIDMATPAGVFWTRNTDRRQSLATVAGGVGQ